MIDIVDIYRQFVRKFYMYNKAVNKTLLIALIIIQPPLVGVIVPEVRSRYAYFRPVKLWDGPEGA